jgi:hypothetical protein
MLRACVLEHQGSWDKSLSWAEISYNNSYQESLKMTPLKVLYGCRCRTPLNWIEPREKVIFGPNLIEEAKVRVHRIQDNLKATKSCQETYANKRRQPLEFEVGDHVYLRVTNERREEVWGERKVSALLHRTIPHPQEYGTVAYKLDLPPSLTGVHDIFHMLQLKKCLKAPVDVVLPEVTPLEADLTYPEHPIKILD